MQDIDRNDKPACILVLMRLFRLAGLFAMALLARDEAFGQPQPADHAALSANSARLVFRLIDAHGNLEPGGKVREMAWVWTKATPNDPIESPALRVWLETRFPSAWAVQKITGDGVTVAEPFEPGSTQTIALDLRAKSGSLRIDFRDRNGASIERTLAVQMTVARPYVLISPNCTSTDVRMTVTKAEARHLYVGLACKDLGDSYDVYFFRSKDSAWARGAGLVQFDAENKFAAFKYHFGKPGKALDRAETLFRVGTSDEGGRLSQYHVFYQSIEAPRRLHGRAGLSPIYRKAYERRHAVDLSQFSMSAQLGGTVHLWPDKLFVSLDFNGDLFHLHHTPDAVTEARFFGVEARAGYRLPFEIEPFAIDAYLGWYLWGMTVPEHRYGISSLNGPQAFVQFSRFERKRPGWWVSFKYATIAEHIQISHTNRELGASLGVELGAHDSRPFAVTADFRHAFSELSDQTNAIRWISLGLGVQKAF